MSKAQEQREQRAQAVEELRELCPPGTDVYVVLQHFSASGGARVFTAYVIAPDKWNEGKPTLRGITHLLVRADIASWNHKHGGVNMGYEGADELVIRLGQVLFGIQAEQYSQLRAVKLF